MWLLLRVELLEGAANALHSWDAFSFKNNVSGPMERGPYAYYEHDRPDTAKRSDSIVVVVPQRGK